MATLFERAVAASGLSEILGPGVVKRACERAGITEPEKLNRHQLLRALPAIEAALGTYLGRDEVKERVEALLFLTRSSSSTLSINLLDPKLEEDED